MPATDSRIRHRIASVLSRLAGSGSVPFRRARAFRECCGAFMLLKSKDDPSTYRVACTTCHDRLCPQCGAVRGRELAAALAEQLPHREWRFITLTLKADGQSLKARIRRLYESFVRLRKSKPWRAHVLGAIAVLEVTRPSPGHWHPHLHVLATGRFWPQESLANAWEEATYDSRIVHITRVRSHAGIRAYLTSYLGKPIPESCLADDEAIAELAIALASVRMVSASGVCHGHTRLLKRQELSAWSLVGSVERLLMSDRFPAERKGQLRAVLAEAMETGMGVTFEFDSG